MNRCTSEVLESYLAKYGWRFRSVGEGLWKTSFQTDGRDFPLLIILTDNILSLVVQPFLDLSIDWERWPEVSRLLLEMNSRSSLVKISIGAAGNMELSIEVLSRPLDYDSFTMILGLLSYYTETYAEELEDALDLIGYTSGESFPILA